MSKARILVGVGLAGFLVFACIGFPARLAADLFAPDSVALHGVSGSVWRGEAQSVQIENLRLRRTRWQLRPWSLLLARVAGQLETEWPGGFATGDFSIGITGSVRLAGVEAAGPATAFTRALGLPGTAGDVAAELELFRMANGWPQSVVGSVRVRDVPLVIPGMTDINAASGAFAVTFDVDPVPDSGDLTGQLTDLGGPLEVTGTIRFSPPASYELEGLVRARPDAPRALAEGLVLAGPEQPDGRRLFSLAGSF